MRIGGMLKKLPGRRLAVWGLIVLVIIPPFVWTLLAINGARSFARDIDLTFRTCDSPLDPDVEFFAEGLEALPENGPLAPVANAFRRSFSQESWAYSFAADNNTGDIVMFREGDLYGRSESDGFEGLLTADRAIARFDSSRFWVDACPRFIHPDVSMFGQGDHCVSTTTDGTVVTTIWAVTDERCEDSGIRMLAVTEDGNLRSWTLSFLPPDGSPASLLTQTVVDPPDTEWPSRFSIVPRWISNRMEASQS